MTELRAWRCPTNEKRQPREAAGRAGARLQTERNGCLPLLHALVGTILSLG